MRLLWPQMFDCKRYGIPQLKRLLGGKASSYVSVLCFLGAENDSVPSKVPRVEVVRGFDVVKRVGTEMSGVTLDPEEVERECELE